LEGLTPVQFYIYNADQYCEDCGQAIKDRLKAEGHAPANPDDEHTYDSGEYPKGPYVPNESDGVDHCGSGDDCVNAIELSDGRKIGAWLENELTADGVSYVRQAIREALNSGQPNEVVDLWAEWYEDYDLGDDDEDEDDEDDFEQFDQA
jgi:hypothetical protein